MSWRISRQDYYNFFRAADTNNDGYISMKELKAILHKFDYRGSDSDVNVRNYDVIDVYICHCILLFFILKVMFHSNDLDGDNLLSLNEFWRAMGQFGSRRHV